ncbi:MAG: hypothetical protein JW807_03145 [Spirochaetes bacterium]|nr:hypothetical protein [Spirochaetota bacterium]
MKRIVFLLVFILVVAQPIMAAEKMTMAIMDFAAHDFRRADAVKVSELIRNELINSGAYILIERAQVDKILKEQGFQMTGCTDVTCAVQVGKLLSARKILVGSIMRIGDSIAITGRVVDVEKGIDEFSEKVTVSNHNDLISGVDEFCSKLTERITGKKAKPKEDASNKIKGVRYYSYTGYSSYDAVSDPTTWISLGSLIAGGIVCAGGALHYKFTVDPLKMQSNGSLFMLAGSSGFGPAMALYFLMDSQSKKDAIKRAERGRNTAFYVGAGFGGFAAIMFITFIGRYIHYNTADAAMGAGDIAVVFPPENFVDPYRMNTMSFNFSIGLARRF